MSIHKTALISDSAFLDAGVEVGPYTVIGDEVKIGKNTRIGAHVVIEKLTHIGTDNWIGHGSVLGADPQHVRYRGERSFLKIGNRNVIRDLVTIHRSFKEGSATLVGDDNYIMGSTHIGHDCVVGNHVVLTNFAGLAGHTVIEDHVVMGGMTGTHQYVRIGRYAMVAGGAIARQDQLPFCVCAGDPAMTIGVNLVGLNRHGFTKESMIAIRKALRLWTPKLLSADRMQALNELADGSDEIKQMITFIEESKRGVVLRQARR